MKGRMNPFDGWIEEQRVSTHKGYSQKDIIVFIIFYKGLPHFGQGVQANEVKCIGMAALGRL